MRGNMKVWIVVVWIVAVATWIWWNVPDWLCLVASIVVATWIWWNAVVRPAPLRRRRVAPLGEAQADTRRRRRVAPWTGQAEAWRGAARVEQRYQTVTFTTKNATNTSYTQFIEALRARLASGEERHGIPVMRERSIVPDNERFILVELSNWEEDSPVTLAVDVTNAYVVAYRTGGHFFFLREDNPGPAIDNLFLDTERDTLPFSGSYTDLERVAGKKRENIALGMPKLGLAIKELSNSDFKQKKSLSDLKQKKSLSDLAHSLIVVIEMVAEAVRFKPIEKLVCDSFCIWSWIIPPKLDTKMLEDVNKWGTLSKKIQQSDELEDISSPVAIMLFVRRTGQP